MKLVSGRLIAMAIVPLLVITGFWNWTRDQVRSQPVDTVPHEQGANEFDAPVVEMVSVRRVSPAIAAWEEARSQAEDLGKAAASLDDGECLMVSSNGVTVIEESTANRVSRSGRRLLDVVMALDKLGADTVLSTSVMGPEPVGGVIDGDLVLVGGGDPAVVSSSLSFLAADAPWGFTEIDVLVDGLVASGVRRVTGDIVGDRSLFVEEQLSPGDLPSWSGLIVDDGRILTSAQNRGIDSAQTAAKTFLDLLRSAGISVEGSARTGVMSDDAVPLAIVESPPLRVIVLSLLRSNLSTDAWSVAFGNIESLFAIEFGVPPFPESGLNAMVTYLNDEYGTKYSLSSGEVQLSCAEVRVLGNLLLENHSEFLQDVVVGGVAASGVVIADGADSIVFATTSLGAQVTAMGDLDSLERTMSDVFDVIDRFSAERDPLAFSPEVVINGG